MHRFLETWTIGRGAGCDLVVEAPGVAELHARLARRADGAIWLLAANGERCMVDRGHGWAAATRLWICAGDRIKLGSFELTREAIGGLLGAAAGELEKSGSIESELPATPAPTPLRVPPERATKARRDPGTGQVETLGTNMGEERE